MASKSRSRIADNGVAKVLAAGAVEADVVGGPAAPEVLAPGGKLADQLDELLVVRVAAGFGPEHGGDVVGGAVPVGEELPCGRVEVDEAGVVRGPARVGEDRGVQGAGEAVGGEHVVPGVAHPGGRVGDGVQDLLDAVGDAGGLRRCRCRGGAGWAARARSNRWARSASSSCKRAGDAVEDGVGGAGQVSSLHADVVVDAHPGEQRDLFAPQALHPAVAAAVGGQPGLGGRDALAPREEELADLGSVIHELHGKRGPGARGRYWHYLERQALPSGPRQRFN